MPQTTKARPALLVVNSVKLHFNCIKIMHLKQKIPLALLEKNMNAFYEKYFSGHIHVTLVL